MRLFVNRRVYSKEEIFAAFKLYDEEKPAVDAPDGHFHQIGLIQKGAHGNF